MKAWAIIGPMSPSQLAVRLKFNPVTNLSQRIFKPSETTILRNGLSFIPSNRSEFEDVLTHINKAFEKLTRGVRWLHKHKGEGQTHHHSRLKQPSTASPPKAPAPVEDYLISCKKDIITNASSLDRRMRFNYKKQDLRDLHKILDDKTLSCLASDKNLGPVILDSAWELKEAHRHLHDPVTYEEQKLEDFDFHANNVLNHIINNRNSFLQTGDDKDYDGLLQLTKKAITHKHIPSFKLLPKLHKLKRADLNHKTAMKKLKGRPLIGAHSCPTAYLSIWIHERLAPFVEGATYVLKDSRDLVNTLERFKTKGLPPGYAMGVADVASLYPNIPTKEGVEIVYDYLLSHGMDPALASLVRSSLLIVLKNNFFQFRDTFWLQINGTAMGTHCGPDYANLFLAALEDRLSQLQIIFFKRFLDDLILLARNRAAAARFFKEYGSLFKTINLEVVIANSIDFLDLTVTKCGDRRLNFRLYSKPFNKFGYLPFSSAHPMHMKKAFIKGLLINLVVKSSHFHLFFKDLALAYARLRDRGYPASLLDPVFKDPECSYGKRDLILSPPPLLDADSPTALCFFNVPYNASFIKLHASRVFHENWALLGNCETFLSRPPLTAWSRAKNISDIINVANNVG